MNGSLEYWLFSPNSTVSVFSAINHTVTFDSNRLKNSNVSRFFVSISKWTSQALQAVLIGAGSSHYRFVGNYARLNVRFTCYPGFFVNISHSVFENTTKAYEVLSGVSSNPNFCGRCPRGTYSVPDTMNSCINCTAGTYSNADNTDCIPCPAATWSPSGSASCIACDTNTTTRERDHCVTLKFLSPPPRTVVSLVAIKFPVVVLVDVFGSVLLKRSGVIKAQLQCIPPACATDLNAEFDLITVSLEVINGTTSANEIFFSENSQIKVGTGFIWRLFTMQDSGATGQSIPLLDVAQRSYSVMFLGVSPSLKTVLPSQVASVGGTVLTVRAAWKLNSRIFNSFLNESAFCVFQVLHQTSNASNLSCTTSLSDARVREVMIPLLPPQKPNDISEETSKTCEAPAVPDFSIANLTIILEDGRRSSNFISVISVCHNNFYVVNDSTCLPCPTSALGLSMNRLINAESVEKCVCSAGSYGTFGQFCRFCPKPSLLPSEPFICNSSNLLWPVVAPGYWVDFSLLSRCDETSATCVAVTTCAFGPRACPGGGEKICAQNDAECYEGKGCSNCCPMYYNENSACFKCPDSTQTTALLAVVGAVCFILAVLMSSVSSPQFTQSSKCSSVSGHSAHFHLFFFSQVFCDFVQFSPKNVLCQGKSAAAFTS